MLIKSEEKIRLVWMETPIGKELFDKDGFLMDSFMQATGLQKDLSNEIYSEFFNNFPNILQNMKELSIGHNFDQLKDLVHRLKGSSSNLRIVIKLEEAVLKQDEGVCDKLIEEIENHDEFTKKEASCFKEAPSCTSHCIAN